jgi:hypothetical protein
MATDPHNRATATIASDPWSPFAERCRTDAKVYVDSAIIRARMVEGHPMPSGCVTAGLDAMAMLYGSLMAKNARLSAEVEQMRARLDRPGWFRRLFQTRART